MQNDYITKTEFKSAINAINTTLKSHSTDLKDLKTAVSGLKVDVGALKIAVSGLRVAVNGLQVAINGLKISITETNRSLSKLTGIVLRIEQRNNIYSEMYEINKGNVNKLANRVNKLEKQTGITPPQELLISGL